MTYDQAATARLGQRAHLLGVQNLSLSVSVVSNPIPGGASRDVAECVPRFSGSDGGKFMFDGRRAAQKSTHER